MNIVVIDKLKKNNPLICLNSSLIKFFITFKAKRIYSSLKSLDLYSSKH